MNVASPESPAFALGSSSAPAERPNDPHLIEETRHQIRQLVNEITQLSQSDVSVDDFCEAFLTKVTSALAATGAAIWMIDEGGGLRLQYQINLSHTGLTEDDDAQAQHALLLKKAVAQGQPTLVGPRSGADADNEAANPTDYLVILGPVNVEQQPWALVEVFQRPGGGPATHRGYLRFLMQMCELGSDFLKNRRLRQLHDQQALWERLEQFVRQVYRGLDPRKTAYVAANEGRRLIDCDRVSLAICRSGRCHIEAVSGLDSINPRAAEIKLLGRLATAVTAADEPLWYDGDDTRLAPQVERHLHAYIDRSLTRSLSIVPLHPTEDEDETGGVKSRRARPQGALIVENFHQRRPSEAWQHRVETVAQHSAMALANAREHHRLFLLPLWKALGSLTSAFEGRAFPKALATIVLLTAVAAVLIFVPRDFSLASRGVLQPVTQQDVFARMSGDVTDVKVRHGDMVRQGDVLATLRNIDLEVSLTETLGRRTATREQMHSAQHELLHNTQLTTGEQTRLQGKLLELRDAAASIDRELALLKRKEELLVVRSPLTGQVVTWQAYDSLMHRPVETGDVLVTIAEPEGDWELELRMPERRMGHLAAARQQFGEDLKATYHLGTHPGKEFAGRVVEIHGVADVHDDEGNTVLVRVAVNRDEIPDLRPGVTVNAKVHCGERSLGYVLFHELFETVQTMVMFWL